MSFSQLPAVKKDTENGAPGNSFGPSYFVTALVHNVIEREIKREKVQMKPPIRCPVAAIFFYLLCRFTPIAQFVLLFSFFVAIRYGECYCQDRSP